MNPVQIAVHDGGYLAHFVAGPMIFDHLIGLEHIRSNLAAPGNVFLLPDDRIELRFFLLSSSS